MTATIDTPRTSAHHGRVHRRHPQFFPHPRAETVLWYTDDSDEPTEPGCVRFTDTDAMLAALQHDVDAANQHATMLGRPLQVGIGRSPATGRRGVIDTDRAAAVLVFIDSPLTLLDDATARRTVMDAVQSTACTGIYVCFQLNRVSRAAVVNTGAWGTELLEYLRRHDAGYPVYGNW